MQMCYFNSAIPVLRPIEDTSPPHPHSHLKTIRMTGFYGLHGQLELALYLLRNATSLKRMVIDPVVRNNSYIPPLLVAERHIYQGRITARTKLWRNNEFRGVLDIL